MIKMNEITYTTATSYTTATEIDVLKLARLLHIDSDNEDEIANATFYQFSAEKYLEGAGVIKDYSNPLYLHLIVTLVARSLERPDEMSKFQDIKESGLTAMIAQLRLTQKAELQ